jgi:hypothetical protein
MYLLLTHILKKKIPHMYSLRSAVQIQGTSNLQKTVFIFSNIEWKENTVQSELIPGLPVLKRRNVQNLYELIHIPR